MRRFKQELALDDCEKILCEATAGVLSLCGDEGMPYGVPLSFVYHDDRVIFHSALQGQKLDLIKQNPKACFTVIGENDIHPERYTTYYKSVMAFGTIRMVDDELERIEKAKLLGRKYNPDDEDLLNKEIDMLLKRMIIFELVIDNLTGKQSIELV